MPWLRLLFWQVNDQLYDLEGFAKRHPGGAHWINRTKGSDITVFFETHHVDIVKARNLLKKYHVRASSPPSEESRAYTWHQNDFYSTLRDRVYVKLKEVGGTGPTWQVG